MHRSTPLLMFISPAASELHTSTSQEELLKVWIPVNMAWELGKSNILGTSQTCRIKEFWGWDGAICVSTALKVPDVNSGYGITRKFGIQCDDQSQAMS